MTRKLFEWLGNADPSDCHEVANVLRLWQQNKNMLELANDIDRICHYYENSIEETNFNENKPLLSEVEARQRKYTETNERLESDLKK